MTKNDVKEEISNSFVKLIVNRLGHKIAKPEKDHGVDFLIREMTVKNREGKVRIIPSGKTLDVQMKSTTEKRVILSKDRIHFTYKCEAKTYRDLIERRNSGTNPLILILFILPENEKDWVVQAYDSLTIRKHAFWFIPEKDAKTTTNSSSISIKIPTKNIFNKDGLIKLFNDIYN
ncbi:MAG: DUF4365 domain-containing protein [Bacteroidota bacterium]